MLDCVNNNLLLLAIIKEDTTAYRTVVMHHSGIGSVELGLAINCIPATIHLIVLQQFKDVIKVFFFTFDLK